MSFARNQATTKAQMIGRRKKRQKHFYRLTYTVLAVSLFLWGYNFLRQTQFFLIRHIQVEGTLQHADKTKISNILQPLIHSSLFSLNQSSLHQALVALPWIKQVDIHRDFPHELIIKLNEKQVVASFNGKALIDKSGNLFTPEDKSIIAQFPEIIASKDLLPAALKDLQTLQLILASQNLKIKSLILAQRNSVTLILTNGLKILLGKQNMSARLETFLDIYPKVFENRLNQVQYIDMRYTNGMAVKWATANR